MASLTFSRIAAASRRRFRLLYFRFRYPAVTFCSQCDVRFPLTLRYSSTAEITFGRGCVVDSSMTIECNGRLSVGARTIFGHHCTLAVREAIHIGPDCLIAEMVSIRDHDHCFDRLDVPTREQGENVQAIHIGRNVWIGAKVTITRGCTIGDNSVIGANAVVTADVPANAIAVGVPARVKRLRTSAEACQVSAA